MCTIDLNNILSPTADTGGVWSYLGFDANSSTGAYTDNPGITVPDLTITQEINLDLAKSGYYRFQYTIPSNSDCDETSAIYTIQYLNSCAVVQSIIISLCSNEGTVSIRDFINTQRLRSGCNGSFITGGVWDLGTSPGTTIVGDDVEVDAFALANAGGTHDIIYDYSNLAEFSTDGSCEECFVTIRVRGTLEAPDIQNPLNFPDSWAEPDCDHTDPRAQNSAAVPQVIGIGETEPVAIVRDVPTINCNTLAILPTWERAYGLGLYYYSAPGQWSTVTNAIATDCPDCETSITGLRPFPSSSPQSYSSGQGIVNSRSIRLVFDQVPTGKYVFVARAGISPCFYRFQPIYIQVGIDCTTVTFGATYNAATGVIETSFTNCPAGITPGYTWTAPNGADVTPAINPETLTPTVYGNYTVDANCANCDKQETVDFCDGYGDGVEITESGSALNVNFDNSNCGASNEPFRWVLTDGSFVNNQPSITPAVVGAYTIQSQCDNCISNVEYEWCQGWDAVASNSNGNTSVGHTLACDGTPTYSWTTPSGGTGVGENIVINQDGKYEVTASCGNCEATDDFLECIDSFTITVDNVDPATGVFTVSIDTSGTNVDELRVTGVLPNGQPFTPILIPATGGIDQVTIDTDQNGNLSVIVEPIYNSYPQGSCPTDARIFDTCDYFSCTASASGNTLSVEGLNCGPGDSFSWTTPGVNKSGQSITAEFDGVYTVQATCDTCTGSDQLFVCNGLDPLTLSANKNGTEFTLFPGGSPAAVDWAVDTLVDGNNVGSLTGITPIVIDASSYAVAQQGTRTIEFQATPRYQDLSGNIVTCSPPETVTDTYCNCTHNLGFGLTFHDGVSNVLTFILPSYFDDSNTIVVLSVNGLNQQYFLADLDSEPAPGGNTRYFFFQFSVGDLYVLSVNYECCNYSATRDFTG